MYMYIVYFVYNNNTLCILCNTFDRQIKFSKNYTIIVIGTIIFEFYYISPNSVIFIIQNTEYIYL